MGEAGARKADASADLRTVVVLFLAALVVRLACTILRDIGDPIPPGSDSISYDAFARAILSGTEWITRPGPEIYRPPGYPMVLAVLYAVTGSHLAAVQCLQSIAGAATVALVYAFGCRQGARVAGLLTAVWLLVNPLQLDFNGKLLRETWLVLLNVGLLMSLLARDGRTSRGVWRTGLSFTVLAHFDSRYVFHLPFFGLYYVLAAGSKGSSWLVNVRRAVRPAALFTATVLLFSAPWAVRNAMAYDRFVLIDPRALDRWGRRAQSAVSGDARSPADLLARFEADKEARLDQLPPEEAAAYRAGLRPTSGQPHKALFNFAEFWRLARFSAGYRPFPDARFAGPWSIEHNVSSLLFMGLLLPGFLWGAWRALATADRAGLVLLAFVLVHTLLHVLVHSVTRYRLPVEPFYAFLAFREMSLWRRRGA